MFHNNSTQASELPSVRWHKDHSCITEQADAVRRPEFPCRNQQRQLNKFVNIISEDIAIRIWAGFPWLEVGLSAWIVINRGYAFLREVTQVTAPSGNSLPMWEVKAMVLITPQKLLQFQSRNTGSLLMSSDILKRKAGCSYSTWHNHLFSAWTFPTCDHTWIFFTQGWNI